MSKKKIIAIVIPVAIVLIFLIGLGSQPYVNTNVEAITGVDKFVVLDQGSQYMARFSLVDNDFAAAADDVKVHFSLAGWKQDFDVSASEFAQYQLQLTGQEFTAYAWPLPEEFKTAMTNSVDSVNTAYITVTLSDGREFTADTSVF